VRHCTAYNRALSQKHYSLLFTQGFF
jgi:hypothetical protein